MRLKKQMLEDAVSVFAENFFKSALMETTDKKQKAGDAIYLHLIPDGTEIHPLFGTSASKCRIAYQIPEEGTVYTEHVEFSKFRTVPRNSYIYTTKELETPGFLHLMTEWIDAKFEHEEMIRKKAALKSELLRIVTHCTTLVKLKKEAPELADIIERTSGVEIQNPPTVIMPTFQDIVTKHKTFLKGVIDAPVC